MFVPLKVIFDDIDPDIATISKVSLRNSFVKCIAYRDNRKSL